MYQQLLMSVRFHCECGLPFKTESQFDDAFFFHMGVGLKIDSLCVVLCITNNTQQREKEKKKENTEDEPTYFSRHGTGFRFSHLHRQ